MVAIPGTVRLVEATAALGSGRLQATGDAALPGGVLGAYRLRLTARDLPLRPLEGLATVWNADLELTGLESRALLSGDARLVRGSFSRDLVALSAVMTPPPAAGAPRGALPLRIRVMLDDNLVVRTPQARARVGGTLSLQGTTAAPIVLGVLEAREGTVILRGSRYQLERAVIRFADPRRIDPLLDIVATTRIGEYDVTVRVTGHVRDLDISLSSSPPLPRNDLMSLVAFGTTTTSGGAGGVLAGEAARLLANELFDLSGTDSALPEPVRNVMDRTRVSYTHNSEDLGRFGFRVEHEIGGPFLVTAERTSQGYFIIDGVVRLRFR
jgi:translocation and assembly module TamB